MKKISLVSLSLALCFMVGCASNSGVVKLNKPDRSLVVVPVKGQPIIVNSSHAWISIVSFLGAGIPGAIGAGAIQNAVYKNDNQALCAILNQATNFNGERILAEECAKFLKESPKVMFHDVTVHPLNSMMPRKKAADFSEQQLFKTKTNTWEWIWNCEDWRKGPSVAGVLPAPSQRGVFLEVTFMVVMLNRNSEISGIVCMRMIDSETGEIVRNAFVNETFDINRVKDQTFEEGFRKCMNEFARKLLKQLNLL